MVIQNKFEKGDKVLCFINGSVQPAEITGIKEIKFPGSAAEEVTYSVYCKSEQFAVRENRIYPDYEEACRILFRNINPEA